MTHAPLQRLKPTLQAKEQRPLAHVAIALPASVEHTSPQALQLFGSVIVLTQMSPQAVGVLGGQVAVQAKVPATAAHLGAAASHPLPQAPQLVGVDRGPHVVGASGPTVPSFPSPVSAPTLPPSFCDASSGATELSSAVASLGVNVTSGNVQAVASAAAHSASSATPGVGADDRSCFIAASPRPASQVATDSWTQA